MAENPQGRPAAIWPDGQRGAPPLGRESGCCYGDQEGCCCLVGCHRLHAPPAGTSEGHCKESFELLLYLIAISVLTSIAKQMFVYVCVLSLQHVSSCERPGMDESFEPLASMTLLQQSRQNNLKQQQLQRQLANGSITAVTGSKHNVKLFP